MAKKINITLSETAKSNAKIVSYLTLSGGLGYVMAKYIVNDVALTAIFAPAINFILWSIEKELKKEGWVQALKNR